MTTPFAAAAHSFADLVRRIPDDAWPRPGLGDWVLRSLVGHTSRSLTTVIGYLETAAEREDIATAHEYYARLNPADGADRPRLVAAVVLDRLSLS